jgi:hypothetical protein
MFSKEFLAALFALFGKQHRFGLSHRIAEPSFFVVPAPGIPVVSFPCAAGAVEREKEQREHHLVDFVFVVVHARRLSAPAADSIAHHTAHEKKAEPGVRDNALTGPSILDVGLPLDGAFSLEENRRPLAARVSPLRIGGRTIPMERLRKSRKLKITALVVALYLVLSGPLGGLTTFWAESSMGRSRNLAWNIYFGHLFAYAPVLYIAKFTGTGEVVMSYWKVCGWRPGVPF